jgi:hypothetical protein
VPTHIGIEGNEKADQLAEQATGWREQGQPRPTATAWEFTIRLVAALNRKEKEIINRDWAKQWRITKTGQILRALVPEITKKTLEIYKGLPKAACAVLAQARTGKIALKTYLHAINRAEENRCGCGRVQTVAHMLLTCPDHGDLRRQIWGSLSPSCHKAMLNSRVERPPNS